MEINTDYFCNRWQLKNIHTLNMSACTGNYVATAFSAHYKTNIILKIATNQTVFMQEQKALIYFNGNGCVKLLDYDLEKSGLLLELIEPGTQLKTLFFSDQTQSNIIAADVIRTLHKHPISPTAVAEFKTINKWLALLENFPSDNIPKSLLTQARTLAQQLLNTQSDLYLLHGDLHQENILQKDDSWIAIDPQGVVGELAYEIGALVRNPAPELLAQKNPQEIMIRSVNQLSSILAINRQRLIDWSFVQAVLAVCWAEQDNDTVQRKYYIEVAQLLLSPKK